MPRFYPKPKRQRQRESKNKSLLPFLLVVAFVGFLLIYYSIPQPAPPEPTPTPTMTVFAPHPGVVSIEGPSYMETDEGVLVVVGMTIDDTTAENRESLINAVWADVAEHAYAVAGYNRQFIAEQMGFSFHVDDGHSEEIWLQLPGETWITTKNP